MDEIPVRRKLEWGSTKQLPLKARTLIELVLSVETCYFIVIPTVNQCSPLVKSIKILTGLCLHKIRRNGEENRQENHPHVLVQPSTNTSHKHTRHSQWTKWRRMVASTSKSSVNINNTKVNGDKGKDADNRFTGSRVAGSFRYPLKISNLKTKHCLKSCHALLHKRHNAPILRHWHKYSVAITLLALHSSKKYENAIYIYIYIGIGVYRRRSNAEYLWCSKDQRFSII